ncbi:OprO/OprP family phosphate-selective porin [Paludisphaera soli]|uniref:OprO/OprP family phosphate-selective porin n=1 Tax=Paludisphaera soli TaxID=2712865 RepID=UPI0013E9CF6E|nr:porin [Paludisphaera soli]
MMREARTVRLILWATLGLLLTPWSLAAGQEPAPPASEILRQFESRLKALEDENRALREQMRTFVETRGPEAAPERPTVPAPEERATSPSTDSDPISRDLGAPARPVGPTAAAANSRGTRKRTSLNAWLGQGFELTSDNEEFQLQFHNETQVDYRLFDHTGPGSAQSGFFIPRQIWAFNGRLTKSVEYMASFQRGLGSFELRDAFLNFRPYNQDKFMIKAGRYRVPYTYEFYAISNQDLISPERSVYAINFGNNREIGVTAWGVLYDDRLDYAAGAFNGPRNSYEDNNDEPNFIGFVNARPFRHSTRFEFLNFLNLGGTVDVGNSDDRLAPLPLRTSVNAGQGSGSSTASPSFLAFNNTVRESGPRAQYSLHAALFYKRLSLLAEWDYSRINYLPSAEEPRVPILVDAFYVQAGFFLTGEHVTRRGPIEVKRPLNLKRGKDFGLGAIELGARYASLRLGDDVFTQGLADPNLWTNRVGVTDLGVNWYLNQYLKVYLDWQHSDFGAPVAFAPGQFFLTSDLYWARLQLSF